MAECGENVEPFVFFKHFSVDFMKDIWKYLPYRDAQNLRRTHSAFDDSYRFNRRYIDGPICDAIITHQGKVILKQTGRLIQGDHFVNLICRNLLIQADYLVLSDIRSIIGTWSIGRIETLGSLLTDDVIQYLHEKADKLKIKSFGYNHFGVFLPKLDSVHIQWPSRIHNLDNFFEMAPNLRSLQINLQRNDLMEFYETLKKYWSDKIEMIVIKRAVRGPLLPGHIYQEHADFIQAVYIHFGDRLRVFVDWSDLKIILCLPHIREYRFP
ncbi:unnamed protein product [Caenorhabditis angaria]|uniref:Uncharacterized protein n=1 Tax=Caenorhabditis angaria TaxID=860376 RepID=A0A9P1N7W5_9PELO|nr:unnamed protein product [Caenorhabditis angaria]